MQLVVAQMFAKSKLADKRFFAPIHNGRRRFIPMSEARGFHAAKLVREMTQRYLARLGKPRFVVVVSNAWRDDPIDTLLERVEASVAPLLKDLTHESSPKQGLVETLQYWTERIDGNLLIILDQFEEYFLYHAQEDGDGTFAVEFPRAVNRADLRVNFLVAIREDALAKLDFFKGRIPNLFDNYLRILHLDREAARSAIEKPLEEYNRRVSPEQAMNIEPALVEAVLDQVKAGEVMIGETGRGTTQPEGHANTRIETPYLQLVMMRLWNEEMRNDSQILSLDTLEHLGGAKQIVRRHLDDAMATLLPHEQDMSARVFRYLVTPSGTKIAHKEGDLAKYADVSESELEIVLEKLSSSGIRVLRPVSQDQITRYEIFHDVLAPAILDWRARYEKMQEQSKAAEKLARQQQSVRRLWLGVAGLLVLLIVMIILAASAILQTNYAEQQRQVAEQALGVAETQRGVAEKAKNDAQNSLSEKLALNAQTQLSIDPELSLFLATKAVEITRTLQAEDALRQSLAASHVRASLQGHSDNVNIATFSPDGTLVLTASADKTARVWDAGTGMPISELRGHSDIINSATFSPDGMFIVTASNDKTARVWEVRTGKSLFELGHDAAVNNAAFNPAGSLIVTAGSDKQARLWDAKTGKQLFTLSHPDSVNSASFSPDGKFVVTASSDGTARRWDMSNGRPVGVTLRLPSVGLISAEFGPDSKSVAIAGTDNVARIWNSNSGKVLELRGHTSRMTSAAFSPDGKRILTTGLDQTARVWDANTGKPIQTLGREDAPVTSAAFSPDGKFVVTASADKTARVWEISSGNIVTEMRGHTGAVANATFSPDGKLVVTASYDHTARVWEARSDQFVTKLGGDTVSIISAAVSPDSRLMVTANAEKTAWLWDTSRWISVSVLSGHSSAVNTAAFSNDGKFVVTASVDKSVRFWDAITGKSLIEARGYTAPVINAAFSMDGKFVVTVSEDNIVRISDAAGSSVAELRDHTGPVNSAAFSPNGEFVVTASSDRTARLWDTTSGQQLIELRHTGPVNNATFSPDGKLIATASSDMTARLWDATSGQQLFELPHAGPVYDATFSPDGGIVVTASGDQTARIWDTRNGKLLHELRGHAGSVNHASFSPDGALVVTASFDKTARLWTVNSGDVIRELTGHTDSLTGAKFSPDGKFIVTTSRDQTARIYACEICVSLGELEALAEKRVTRDLTAAGARFLPVNIARTTPTPEPTTVAANVTATATSPRPTNTPRVTLRGKIAYTFAPGESDDQHSIWIADADGANPHPVNDTTAGMWPALSPDGNKIAFYRINSGIHIANSDGTNPSRIIPFADTCCVQWSPNSKQIVYFRGDLNKRGSIYIANIDGSGITKVIDTGFNPSWSPDGKRIAYADCRESCGLYVSDLGVATPTPPPTPLSKQTGTITTDGGQNPQWAPRGDKIVYQANESGHVNIFVVSPDGSGRKQLTFNSGNDGQPIWSRDGNFIFWRSDQNGTEWAIWVMDADGKNQRRLISPVPPDGKLWGRESLSASP